MPVRYVKMAEHQAANGQVSVNVVLTWIFLLSNAHQFCSSNLVNNSHHTSCINKGCMLGSELT